MTSNRWDNALMTMTMMTMLKLLERYHKKIGISQDVGMGPLN